MLCCKATKTGYSAVRQELGGQFLGLFCRERGPRQWLSQVRARAGSPLQWQALRHAISHDSTHLLNLEVELLQ